MNDDECMLMIQNSSKMIVTLVVVKDDYPSVSSNVAMEIPDSTEAILTTEVKQEKYHRIEQLIAHYHV